MTRLITETARLRLREFAPEDVEALAPLYADPETSQWLGDGSPRDRAKTISELERFAAMYAARGLGPWAVELRETGEFVGQCGLQPLDDGTDIALGYALAPKWRGRGLALEAATAALAHGFRSLGLTRIVAVAQRANTASTSVMRRLGMTFDHDAVHYGKSVLVYAITRERFESPDRPRTAPAGFAVSDARTTVRLREAGLSDLQREWRVSVDGEDRGSVLLAWWEAPLVVIGTKEILVIGGKQVATVSRKGAPSRFWSLASAVVGAVENGNQWVLAHAGGVWHWNAETGATLGEVLVPGGVRAILADGDAIVLVTGDGEKRRFHPEGQTSSVL